MPCANQRHGDVTTFSGKRKKRLETKNRTRKKRKFQDAIQSKTTDSEASLVNRLVFFSPFLKEDWFGGGAGIEGIQKLNTTITHSSR